MSADSKPTLGWNFDNTYLSLPQKFYSLQKPSTVGKPSLVVFNHALAGELGLEAWDEQSEAWLGICCGNLIAAGAVPLAQAYAGHQFGNFTMLGDGRAILLGEHIGPTGQHIDVQLKGSGRTPYSRGGDGRATVSAMLREYLMSEAMHHLGIPSSRSLAVVRTGEPVYREQVQEGAVLTRLASSHIRVGTFEYARYFLSVEELRELMGYTLQRHYPRLLDEENKALALLEAVMDKQADLLVQWMRVGFIHGVMNTDNMSLAGETIDYGPCAFLNAYHRRKVFSSIDTQGRYAYGNQPYIAHWNLACLATALLPLIHEDNQEGVKLAQEVLNRFPQKYESRWLEMMRRKLGWQGEDEGDLDLVQELLVWMEGHSADYTNTFLYLMGDPEIQDPIYEDEGFVQWKEKWEKRQQRFGGDRASGLLMMEGNNPVFIPRNHLVEQALWSASQENDLGPMERLLEKLRQPYRQHLGALEYKLGPLGGDGTYRTFCGT